MRATQFYREAVHATPFAMPLHLIRAVSRVTHADPYVARCDAADAEDAAVEAKVAAAAIVVRHHLRSEQLTADGARVVKPIDGANEQYVRDAS